MTTRNGTVLGVSLLSGNPGAAPKSTVSSVAYERKAFLVTASFAAWTTGDAATVTGINTAISAATRSGRSLNLIAVVPCANGDVNDGSVAVFLSVAANAAITIANATTTGDATTAILADASGADITTLSATQVPAVVALIAIVDES